MTTPQNDYVVFARRYRPQSFDQVVGQTRVVTQLRNEIAEGRVGHAYLFCGPRGVGKTSMARIYAKALNCRQGPTTTPCGTCRNCLQITAGTDLDVTEVDAATYTKVETMRELLESVIRSPFDSKYKVYIIDEVHMLSASSFNALLKTLEEPPDHVVFILATTNPEKIPETVVSRCRRCEFDRIAVGDIVGRLGEILDKEPSSRMRPEDRGAILEAIALASEGGMRDAQVCLDQLVSLSDGDITLDTARQLLGVVESDVLMRLLKGLAARDTVDCLRLVSELVDRGRDLTRFVKMFVTFLRDAMLLKVGAGGEVLQVARLQEGALREALADVSLPFLLNTIQQFLNLEERMRGPAPPRFLLEFTIVKLTAIDPRLVIDNPPPDGGGTRTARPPAPAPARAPSPAPLAAPPSSGASLLREAAPVLEKLSPPPPVIQEIQTTDKDRFAAFADKVGERLPALKSSIRAARLGSVDPSHLRFTLAPGDQSMMSLFRRTESFNAMKGAASEVWGRPMLPVVEAATSAPPQAIIEVAEPEVVDYQEPAEEVAAPPAPEMHTLAEAMEKLPDFRQAVELVQKAFGVAPSQFNGRPLTTAASGR